jgi:hypothetical protein
VAVRGSCGAAGNLVRGLEAPMHSPPRQLPAIRLVDGVRPAKNQRRQRTATPILHQPWPCSCQPRHSAAATPARGHGQPRGIFTPHGVPEGHPRLVANSGPCPGRRGHRRAPRVTPAPGPGPPALTAETKSPCAGPYPPPGQKSPRLSSAGAKVSAVTPRGRPAPAPAPRAPFPGRTGNAAADGHRPARPPGSRTAPGVPPASPAPHAKTRATQRPGNNRQLTTSII